VTTADGDPVPPRPLPIAAGDGGWTYVWDHRRKPHLHPVATPSGLVLTRVEPPDHPWQRGVWFYATCRAGPGYGDGWANTLYPAFL
jgi:Family of unknown function (DUF6807)